MNDSRGFHDAESVRSGQSQVASQPVSFPPHPVPGGMLSRSLGMPSRNNGPPSIWDTHGISGNVFANPALVQHFIRKSRILGSLLYQNTHHHVMSESQTPVQDLRCQSGPSAKNSVIFSGGRLFKNFWRRPTTTADLRSSFRQIPHTSNLCLLEDKIQDWGMYLFTISYGGYAVDQRSGDG